MLDHTYYSQAEMEGDGDVTGSSALEQARIAAQKLIEMKKINEKAQKLKKLQTAGWKVDVVVLKKSQLNMDVLSFHLLSLIIHHCCTRLFDPLHPPLSPVHQEKLMKGEIIDVGTLETLATEYQNSNVPGLQWEEIDPAELEKGTEFTNDALSAALLDKLQFKQTELEELGATDLSWDNFVRVDEKARCVSQVHQRDRHTQTHAHRHTLASKAYLRLPDHPSPDIYNYLHICQYRCVYIYRSV